MNIFESFRTVVLEALSGLDADREVLEAAGKNVTVEPPRDPAHGDLSTNAAMVLAKPLKQKPRDIAEKIAAVLERNSDIVSVAVAGPGFINMTLDQSIWGRVLADILERGADFGRAAPGSKTRANVEYVSANPTGPMHVGHCRGAVVGDALASLLEFAGHDVTREYYTNDAGSQIDTLGRSVWLRYLEALGEDIGEIPEGLYPGDYLVPVGEALKEKYGDGLKGKAEAERTAIVKDFAVSAMMDMIRADLGKLGIRHDVFFSEKSLIAGEEDLVAKAINELEERGLVYEGTLPPPKGQLPDDWEDREQTLFRSTEFGDDVDRALKKSDGSYTYFASDIAYHYDKFVRSGPLLIDILGADHGGYAKRMKAAVKAMSRGEGALEIEFCQLVKLFRDGEPVKMSKRSGNFVTLADVVDEVGKDAVRFMMLMRKNDAPLDFDFAKVTEQSRDNPVFYVQYAHARTASIFRQAGRELGPDLPDADDLKNAGFDLLTDEGEINLMKMLATYPRIVDAAAGFREPHRIAFYLYDLASAFHAHWNRGKDQPDLRFIIPSGPELTRARLGLVGAVAGVLKSGLSILGVDAPDEMG